MAYTFKDDGQALTYYREYNKEVGSGDKTLIGNWVEERALRADADSGRYKLWTSSSTDQSAPQKSFTKAVPRPDGVDTFRRTIAHDDHLPSSHYSTSNQARDPGYCQYAKPEKGAREKRLEQRAMQQAQATAPQPMEAPVELGSTHRSEFVPKDLPPKEERGARIMEGKPDLQWRKELGLVAPHRLEDPNRAVVLEPERTNFGKNTTFSSPVQLAKSGLEKDC